MGERHVVDAHRRHRGPYTAAAGFIHAVWPRLARDRPDLIPPHLLTLLSVAPEIGKTFPVPAEVTASFRFSREGNTPSWTLRLAHGLADFFIAYFAHLSPIGNSVTFEQAAEADPIDREFMAILMRRIDPHRLTVRVCCASAPVDEPLASAICSLGRIIEIEIEPEADGGDGDAAAYVAVDCCAPDGAAAYAALPEEARRNLHAARAAALEARDEFTLSLGAVPFHRMQAGDGIEALLLASDRCMEFAYYDQAMAWAGEGRRVASLATNPRQYRSFTRNQLFAPLIQGRIAAAEQACAAIEAEERDPTLLAHAAYARATLNARLYPPERRDYATAAAMIERALALTDSLPETETRAVNRAFLVNTMALVHMRRGADEAAMAAMCEALDHLRRHAPSRYDTECELLLHNRARLHIAAGRSDAAIADLTTVLGFEPSNSEALFDRGLLHQRAGRFHEALDDYDAAIRWSPPYLEPHFNRAQTLAALGRAEAAIADYDRVLELEPKQDDARLNRALLHFECGALDSVAEDLGPLLIAGPANAKVVCLKGLLLLKRGETQAALESFSQAIDADPNLADAWANRASAHYKLGDAKAALLDLDRAIALRPDPDMFFNRDRIAAAGGVSQLIPVTAVTGSLAG